MTDEDIRRIQSELAVVLPERYREVMTSTDARASTDFWYGGMFNSAAAIVDRTSSLRETMLSFGKDCPLSWVVVSEINGGNAVIIDVDDSTAALRYFDHEAMSLDASTDSLTGFIESCKNFGL